MGTHFLPNHLQLKRQTRFLFIKNARTETSSRPDREQLLLEVICVPAEEVSNNLQHCWTTEGVGWKTSSSQNRNNLACVICSVRVLFHEGQRDCAKDERKKS
ncbi:hypothetical protein CDAR_411391 [Caerostris darwini]|uniref:Uncharacterized protein n=1 Tax=Caerostris darwini TaxID=1538125 RepID=A0AAV4SEE0_9ARAC|nr:hypothetical protein CDAR_411391 [Caerostris darwini]